jgi:hypothetical protein
MLNSPAVQLGGPFSAAVEVGEYASILPAREPLRGSMQASRYTTLVVALSILVPQTIHAGGAAIPRVLSESPAAGIPYRAARALTGSQFAEFILHMDSSQRELAIRGEILNGNIPDFLRKLVPVKLRYSAPGGETVSATIFVTPDYLSIGSNSDFLRIPMNLYTAEFVASHFGFILPTKKMVDAIYAQSTYHLAPQPMPAGPQMRSTEYYRTHNQMIQQQVVGRGIPSGAFIAGHKKDVVVTNRLTSNEGRIAIYGWHRGPGEPIQPLSTVHGAHYADYSHGIRLVSDIVLMDGKRESIYDLLRDPHLANVLSSEGAIPNPWGFTSTPEDTQTAVLSVLLDK